MKGEREGVRGFKRESNSGKTPRKISIQSGQLPYFCFEEARDESYSTD